MKARASLGRDQADGAGGPKKPTAPNLRRAGVGRAREPKTAHPVAGRRGRRYLDDEPDRLMSVHLAMWTEFELEALEMALELEKANRQERLDEELAAKADATIAHTRHVEQWSKCSKAGCRCASGERSDLHGPYWYAVDTYESGRRKKRYVGKERPQQGKGKR